MGVKHSVSYQNGENMAKKTEYLLVSRPLLLPKKADRAF